MSQENVEIPHTGPEEGWRIRGPRDIALAAVPLVLFVGALCAIGVFATSRQCDVTRLVPISPQYQAEYESGFCNVAHFPGLPDTLESGLFVAGVWGAPLIVALIGAIAAVALNRPRVLWISTIAASFLALAAWIMSAALADVHYKFI